MLIIIHFQLDTVGLRLTSCVKAMGKNPSRNGRTKRKLMKGIPRHGLSKSKADELWARIEPFAAYGFNKKPMLLVMAV